MSTSVAIVTGASQGIGRSTAIRLARDFSSIVLAARDRPNLEKTADAVKAAGSEPLVIDIDLAETSAAKSVVDQTLSAFGRIDALLNIAGAVPQINLFEMTDAQWDSGLALKLHGARRLTIAAWPALKEAKGSVVLMSGNSALFPKAPYAAVGTINAAIVALAKAFSDRGIADGVQVNSVLPGPVMTGRRRSYLAHWAPLHNMTVEEATARFPASRHRALWRTGGDRRTDGLPGIAGRPLDDRLDAADGWRRGQIGLRLGMPELVKAEDVHHPKAACMERAAHDPPKASSSGPRCCSWTRQRPIALL
jgi:3-oxoacyl-[acyl-carrier protein] reductase